MFMKYRRETPKGKEETKCRYLSIYHMYNTYTCCPHMNVCYRYCETIPFYLRVVTLFDLAFYHFWIVRLTIKYNKASNSM